MEIPPRNPAHRWDKLAPFLSSLLCLLTLLLFHDRFQLLYWFHDDWDLLSGMQSRSTLEWIATPHGVNFDPIFKLIWKTAVISLGGSYFGMIVLLWVVHLGILWLAAALLRQCGMDVASRCLAVLTLGMPWSNIESLGWAVCLDTLLSDLFLLLAWVFVFKASSRDPWKWPAALALIGALLSALSFARGVFSGALLAFFLLHSVHGAATSRHRARWMAVAFASVTATSLIPYRWILSSATVPAISWERLSDGVSFGVHYLLLNPLYHLLPIPRKAVGPTEMMIAGALKLLLIAIALRLSKDTLRSLLWTLLLLDVTMAVMLGLGRSQLPLDTAVSYRYQHVALLCFAPFFAIAVMHGLALFRAPAWRAAAFAVIFTGWGLLLGYPWLRHSERWAGWRGVEVRSALASAPPDQRFGLASITAARARELTDIYNLH
jgi:hypothetical protein